jgi:hypothetical protein
MQMPAAHREFEAIPWRQPFAADKLLEEAAFVRKPIAQAGQAGQGFKRDHWREGFLS